MAMYWTCRYGANHDFGEKCDCARVQKAEQEKKGYIFVEEKGTGQFSFNWKPEERGA